MALILHETHLAAGARLGPVNGQQTVLDHGDPVAELRLLRERVALLDLSSRSRLCLVGSDRRRFLNGQVTQDVRALAPGQGCYACLLNAKGRIESDLNIHCLEEEFLLDFEPGLADAVRRRLEAYIIAEEVQVIDAGPHYGLLALAGPAAPAALAALMPPDAIPSACWTSRKLPHPDLGELYAMRQPVAGADGFLLYIPLLAMEPAARLLSDRVRSLGGGWAGWDALEMLRIESGLPRFGADMDSTNLPPEAGLESRAISYSKGCYIGQEIIARIRTYGQVARTLRGLRLDPSPHPLPARGDKLRHEDKEVGHVTSALHSPTLDADIALGYVRREHNEVGRRLTLLTAAGERSVELVPLPFVAVVPMVQR